ncbi:baseplate J/gp47 family protein [Paenibacillus larvae]|nr:baseplate J/gp47 family protein [Paenibacillus larvae]MDT2242281.1 baseplate J/gp47 family protein [Paenibacillus larvae]
MLEIKAGKVSGTITTECSIAGDVGNGFLPGQLNVLVDPIPFIQSVTNTTESAGGAEEETDDSYRERIRSAPESFLWLVRPVHTSIGLRRRGRPLLMWGWNPLLRVKW